MEQYEAECYQITFYSLFHLEVALDQIAAHDISQTMVEKQLITHQAVLLPCRRA